MEEETVKPRKPDKRSREKQPFEGFTQEIIDKYFCAPNMITDIMADIDSIAELKVIIYVMRHTWGFHEYGGDKCITVDEFMHGRKHKDKTRMDRGTGLSKPAVINGLDLAIEHGFLECEVDDKDKARIKKSYKLHLKSGVKIVDPSRRREVKKDYPNVKSLYPVTRPGGNDSLHRSEKDISIRNTPREKARSQSLSMEEIIRRQREVAQ